MSTPPNPEEAIVDAALELPAHERAAYLDKLCGNDRQLRQLVDALLHAHKKIISSQLIPPRAPSAAPTPSPSASPLEEGAPERRAPGVTTMALSVTPIEKPGDHIGRYKLLQQIGEGGGGIVYMAEQVEPVRRRVALKILKLGMDTKQVIARFEAERQALALMDHPNIAKVHDAGATETGRPYFVMELVRGIKITDYCDQNNLSTETRLDLFIQVCKAAQHAHQKGVIHRDIKPSNILVTLHDGAPVPKVIDFGIAKATTGQPLTDKTVFTAFEQLIGTPAYMSPEQAEMSGLDIDTRSDIYSLGVLLYELLTGQMPFDPRELAASGFEEMRRIIRTKDPLRPSTRLSDLSAADQTTVAKRRQVEAAKLIHLVRGDLDWIVMKCLEKDRGRRYETANGVASDIQRYLNCEPVVARPPSRLYEFQKSVRRHKFGFAAAAALVAVLAAGVLVSTWQAIRATRAERVATQQRDRADGSAEAERTQRQRAEQAVRRANEALSVSLVVEGQRLAREDAAGKALAYFARAARLNPANRVAATRIVSLLNQRNFPLPLLRCPDGFDPQQTITNFSMSFDRNNPPGSDALALSGRSIIDKRSGKEVARVAFDGELHRTPVFSQDGEKMAVLTSSNKIEVFFSRTGERVMHAITARHSGSPPFTLFTADGRGLIVGGKSSGDVEVWDLVSKRPSYGNLQHLSTVWAMATSADGRRLATGVRTGEARLWNLRTGLPSGEPCPGTIDIIEDVLNSSGDLLLTRHRPFFGKNRIEEKFWDVRPGRAIPMTLWHPSGVEHACYSPSGELVATVCGDGTARIWRAEDGAVQAQPIIPGDTVENLAFAPDSSLVALGGTSGTVCLWSLPANRVLWSCDRHSDRVSQLIFSADGKKLATGAGVTVPSGAGDKDGNVNIFETRSGTLLGRITNGFGAVMSLAFAPDARRLAIGYRDYRVEIWDVEKMQRLGETLWRNNGWVWHVCFSHNGKWLATSAGGNATQLWDALAPVNQPLKAYTHGSGVHLACFSSDDKLVLTCSEDRTDRVWERESGKQITEPLPYEAFSFPVIGAFSPDDRAVLAGSGGGATVWDVKSGRELCEAFRQDGGLTCAAFSPDGSHILTAGRDGAVMIHNWADIQETPPGWLMELAEAVGGYRLNDGGVAEYLDGAAQDIVRLRQTLAAADASFPLVKWGRWYLADRSSRPISVNSKISVRDYAKHLANQPGIRALEEALDLDPTNPIIYSSLAKLTQQSRPETASLYRRIARELGGSDLDAPAVEAKAASTAGSNDPSAASRQLLDPTDGQALLQKVGQAVAVKGEVIKFGSSRSGTFHYLDFSQDYTDSLTLAFKIADNPAEFKPELLRQYLNKVVVVQGVVAEYQGRPQFLMKSLGQITLWDEWQASKGANEAPK